ncbi:MAG TPA: YraN family protein [Candidatus Saccharimonadales bacterium]|nr:YraN family protein [Candidatus Saccharimonadales bacterium]
MSTTDTGRQAEAAAADYLQKQGYKIVERNWKTPQCEIDIVAKKGACVYFVEVKYRVSSRQGGGLDYITVAKQRQMRFAAEMWCAQHHWGGDASLAAIEVGGDFAVTDFIDTIY